ncbi:hypothetical protein [Salipiger thiooxidans]|uniref:hypothetical protein n=1 Tax=Salipiger thiooxidans TaxID=282683 RepID=UPI001CF93A45|nr:hypothetical protein [Salipiger thiooxidans]
MRTVRLLFFGLIAIFLLAADEGDANTSFNVNFEQNSCSMLYQSLAEQGTSIDGDTNCVAVAAALTETTGKYPYWLGCLGYGDMPLAAHLARCVMLSARVQEDAPDLESLGECAEVGDFYEASLRAADRSENLPSGYRRPECAEIEHARLIWMGSRPAWLRCRGYDRANEQAHAAMCLLGETRLQNMDTCQEVRKTYEERLLAAYGEKPDGYRPVRCGSVAQLVEQARTALEEIRSQQHAARVRAASQRVRTRRASSQINMEQLIQGLVQLRLASTAVLGDIEVPDQARIARTARAAKERIEQTGLEVLREQSAPELTAQERGFFSRDVEISSAEVSVELEQHEFLFRD